MPRRSTPPRLGWSLVAVVVLLAAACSGSGGSSSHQPTSTTGGEQVLQVDLTDRQFWWGDARGSLFDVTLDGAEVWSTGSEAELRLTGTADNLSAVDTNLDLTGVATIGGRDLSFAGGTAESVAAGATGAVEVAVPGFDADDDLDETALVLGDEGTNQVVVPLGEAEVETGPAPRHHVVPTTPFEIAPGATTTVTGSTLYPRYASGRAGQYRLELQFSVEVGETAAIQNLLLHPSLVDPLGRPQSIGDQSASSGENRFVGGTVIDELVPGTYELTVLEVVTDTESSLVFDLD